MKYDTFFELITNILHVKKTRFFWYVLSLKIEMFFCETFVAKFFPPFLIILQNLKRDMKKTFIVLFHILIFVFLKVSVSGKKINYKDLQDLVDEEIFEYDSASGTNDTVFRHIGGDDVGTNVSHGPRKLILIYDIVLYTLFFYKKY